MCDYCKKNYRACVYVDRPLRVPLTRQNFEFLEEKYQTLQHLLKKLHPDVNLDLLLAQSKSGKDIAAESEGAIHEDVADSEWSEEYSLEK